MKSRLAIRFAIYFYLVDNIDAKRSVIREPVTFVTRILFRLADAQNQIEKSNATK